MGIKRGLLAIALFGIFLIFISLSFVSANSALTWNSTLGAYMITDCTQLQNMSLNLTTNYQLINNIDCSNTTSWNSGAGFVPIGNDSNNFVGNFNGQNHNISNLYINNASLSHVGLFGYFNGNISNVGLSNVNITGSESVGGLVGESYGGVINNSYTSGIVNITSYVGGGLVGYNSGEIANSYSTGNIFASKGGMGGADSFVGGLVGNSEGIVINSSFSGNISAKGNYVGGLVGTLNGNISNSYSTGKVNAGGGYVGGLVGNANGMISSSYSTGNVIATGNNVGGFVGFNGFGAFINNSYSRGNVTKTGQGNWVGGFVGQNAGDIYDSYSTGDVNSGADGSGGFVGLNGADSIHSSYSTGSLTTTAEGIGGFIGQNIDTYSYNNSGWVINSGLPAIGWHTGLSSTIAEITYNETSADAFFDYSHGVYTTGTDGDIWDFTNIWSNSLNGTDYPILQWQNVSVNTSSNQNGNSGNQNQNTGTTVTAQTTSGGGYVPQTYYTDEIFPIDGNNFNLRWNDKIKFIVNFTNHTLTLNQFNSTTAKVLIQSSPITAYLERGILKEFDMNNDSISDVRVRYDGLNNSKAMTFIQEIKQNAIENEKNLTDNSEVSNSPELKSIKNNYLVLGIIAILIIVVILVFILHKKHRKRRYWMYEY